MNLAVLLDHLDELIEQVRRIVRAGPGFRVILNRVDWQAPMSEAFNRVVVQVDVGHFTIRRERVGIDSEAVILRSDLDAPGSQVFHGLIPAVMAEGEFVSPATKRKPHQLMAETDSKNRIAPDQLSQISNYSSKGLGITRPVR